jgi:predicted DsbA family dithiol-disulfide isomerase
LPFELHPETPPEGAPKPFPPERWEQVRARLEQLAQTVGLPIDPPSRNVNSRFALETAELVREQKGDAASGAFHHAVSRAFFTERADIAKPEVILPLAAGYDVLPADVEAAWTVRRYRSTVDAFIEQAIRAGATGVPAMAWPNQRAAVGMMKPEDLVARLGRPGPASG